jgi:hypothetical protein
MNLQDTSPTSPLLSRLENKDTYPRNVRRQQDAYKVDDTGMKNHGLPLSNRAHNGVDAHYLAMVLVIGIHINIGPPPRRLIYLPIRCSEIDMFRLCYMCKM